MGDIVRLAKISAINYEKGTASVIYTDRNNEPSPDFPFFSYAYEMPKANDTVVVLLLQNSNTKGFILGIPWNASNRPKQPGKEIFHKQFSDGTYIRYDARKKEMEITAEKIILKSIKATNLSANSLTITDTAKIRSLQLVNPIVYIPDLPEEV